MTSRIRNKKNCNSCTNCSISRKTRAESEQTCHLFVINIPGKENTLKYIPLTSSKLREKDKTNRMTLYHFGNCLALVYAPYHMAYKFSGISEYATFSKCVYAGGLYIFTQLCKMLLLATFFPDTDSSHIPGEYNIFLEILKATVDFADLLGLYFALNAVPGKGHAKILTSAIGWASAEVLVTRSVLLWVGARGSEFDWRYVRSCAESNVALLHTGASAALVWLWTRSDLARAHAAPVAALLLLAPYRALLEEAAGRALALSAWALLGLRALHATAVGLAALAMYALRAQQLGI